MSLITIIVAICLIVLAFYANNTWVSPPILRIIVNVILIIVVLIVLFSVLGIGNLRSVRV
jgi:hypothetical protein